MPQFGRAQILDALNFRDAFGLDFAQKHVAHQSVVDIDGLGRLHDHLHRRRPRVRLFELEAVIVELQLRLDHGAVRALDLRCA